MAEEKQKEFKVTEGRKVILNALADGQTRKWAELRAIYFGPDRSKSKASTAFHVQLTGLQEKGIVAKNGEGLYGLTDIGNALVSKLRESGVDLSAAKSTACLKFVAKEVVAETPAAPVEQPAEQPEAQPEA